MQHARRWMLLVALGVGATACDDGAAGGRVDMRVDPPDDMELDVGVVDAMAPDAMAGDATRPDARVVDAMMADAAVVDATVADATAAVAPGAGLRLVAGRVVDDTHEATARATQGAAQSQSERYRLRGRLQP